MRLFKYIAVFTLVFSLLSAQVYAAGTTTNNNALIQQPSEPVKKAIPGTAKADVQKVLAIAEKYYKLSLSKATPEEKGKLPLVIYWKPDFSGKTKNTALAMQFSFGSALLTSYTNLKGIYMPLDSAIFVLDVKNPVYAGNLASAITAYCEDTLGKSVGKSGAEAKPYTGDAASVYEYALALKLSATTIDMTSMPLLLNYGYLCIDTGRLDYAKVLFETATRLAPNYLPAKEGLAAYWLAAGDKNKARKSLEGAALPMVYKQSKKTAEDSSDTKAPQVGADDSLATMEEKLKALREAPLVVATDFYSDLDPAGTSKVKSYVNNIAGQFTFNAPGFKYLTEFSTLEAFTSGSGQAAFEGFLSELKSYSMKYAAALYNNNMDSINGLGVDISINGIDINDVIKNPEKYKDANTADNNVTVSGIDELMDKLQDIQDQAGQAESDLNKGDTGSTSSLASTVAPELAIFSMNPGDYADPTDIMTQQYNMTILLRKIIGYKNYFAKQNKDLQDILKDDIRKITVQMSEFEKGMKADLQQLAEEHEAGLHQNEENDEQVTEGIQCDTCKIKTHEIHQKYDPQMNQLCETAWTDATNYVSYLYTNKVKSNIEAMYADCMKNCMLISDPNIRTRKEDEIKTMVYGAVSDFMTNVVTAYSIGPGNYPYHCDCDDSEIEAARERLQRIYDEKEAEKTAMENKARNEFQQGVIKESTQLYKNLDKYSAEYTLGFMHAKWHPLKTELYIDVKVPLGKVEAGGTFKMIQEHIRNTTTYGGGLSAGVKGELGKVGVSGTLSVEGEMTTDGNGNIVRTDYAGSAALGASMGSYEATGKLEASTMRGCKVSGEVTKLTADTLKPPNGGKAWEDFTEATSVFLPEKPKKSLWSGEYQLSK